VLIFLTDAQAILEFDKLPVEIDLMWFWR